MGSTELFTPNNSLRVIEHLVASEVLHEFFTTHLEIVPNYFSHKASINLFTGMIRDNGCSPIGMFKKQGLPCCRFNSNPSF
jgi:hypothetical protein